MATVNLGGYDSDSGQPPDDSTDIPWQRNVRLPGQYGRGGFFNPDVPGGGGALTGPAGSPPIGTSLATPTNTAGMGPHIDPVTGQPEMLTGPGGIVEKTRGAMNPFGFLGGGNPYWRAAIAAGGVMTPTPAETGEMPRQTLGRSPSGPAAPAPSGIGSDANTPVMGAGGFPTTYANPGAQPAMPDGMPPPAIPIGGGPGNVMQAPTGTRRPRVVHAAGPAAVRQQPNLGAYSGPFSPSYRPNADVAGGARGRQSVPQMTTLDLSKLFSRQ